MSSVDKVLPKRRPNHRRLYLIIVGSAVLLVSLLFHRWQGNRLELSRLPSSSSSVIKTDSSESIVRNNNTHWTKIRDHLCPRNVPQADLADRLFELARRELQKDGNNNNKYSFSNTTRSRQRIRQFVSGPYDRGTKLCRNGNYFILYMRIYKCANNQITEWMNDALEECYSKMDLEGSLEILWKNSNVVSSPPPCIITAIRDPISHFLSAYNEVEYQWLANHSNFADPKIKDKLLRNKHLTYLHTTTPYGTTERFSQFVTDFVFHPDAMRQGAFDHLDLMSRMLPTLQEQNLSLTAYLPSLHDLPSTWPQFVQSTCLSGEQGSLKEMTVSAQHESSKDPFGTYQAAEEVWKENGPITRALCILHSMDYACWDQLSLGIPEPCQQIYGEESFMEAILDNLE